jgi:hypothetical protein
MTLFLTAEIIAYCSNRSQHPKPSGYLTHWLTNRLHELLTGPAYNITARTAQRTPFLCCSKLVAKRWHDVLQCYVSNHRHGLRIKHYSSSVYWPLPSNGRLLWLHSSCHDRIRRNMINLDTFMSARVSSKNNIFDTHYFLYWLTIVGLSISDTQLKITAWETIKNTASSS